MKTVKLAYVILVLLTISIAVNSIVLGKMTKSLAKDIESVDISNTKEATIEYEKLCKRFEKAEKYISLSVSHDDLTNIEESFAELIGAADADNTDEMMKAKSRLVDALKHLGRLSGINIDSIM